MKWLLLCLTACLPLHAEKIIQCIANFPVDAEHYTHVLKSRGMDAKVVNVDFKQYQEALYKKKGFFNKIWRKVFSKVSIPNDVEKIVFFNVTPKQARKYDLSLLPKEKLVLFMWEPKTVLRRMYLPKIQHCFSKIYTWNDALVDGKTYFKFNYPVLRGKIESPSFHEKKLCTLIASDLKSKCENELYSERKAAIRFFEKVGESGFEFYGRKWDPQEFSNYRGAPDDKVATMKHYRFAICYENTHGTPGYITEKIFDCFAAGTVPIYWGASNIEQHIPKGCFIDRRNFASMEELYSFIKQMGQEEYDSYLAQVTAFLKSTQADAFAQAKLDDAFFQAVNH